MAGNSTGEGSIAGQRHDMKPKMLNRSYNIYELIQIHGLCNIAVSVETVSLVQILFSVGGGKHHHRDSAQIRIGLDLLEHLTPVLPGKIEIEQTEIRAGRVGVLAAPCQEIACFYAVAYYI